MARSTATPEKRPGFFSQLKSLFKFTREEYAWLPWAQVAVLVGGVLIGLVIGYLIPPPSIWSLVLWGISGLMAGLLGAMFLMTRLSSSAMYKKIDGMPGATGHIMSTNLGRRWQSSDTPVGINPKTHEAVYRAIGRGGIVIVGEGARGRLTRLINEERSKAQRVAHGVPLRVFYVSTRPAKELQTDYKFALAAAKKADAPAPEREEYHISEIAKAIKSQPKVLNRATMGAVIRRIDSVSQSLASLPIPKGIDPNRVRAPRPR